MGWNVSYSVGYSLASVARHTNKNIIKFKRSKSRRQTAAEVWEPSETIVITCVNVEYYRIIITKLNYFQDVLSWLSELFCFNESLHPILPQFHHNLLMMLLVLQYAATVGLNVCVWRTCRRVSSSMMFV